MFFVPAKPELNVMVALKPVLVLLTNVTVHWLFCKVGCVESVAVHALASSLASHMRKPSSEIQQAFCPLTEVLKRTSCAFMLAPLNINVNVCCAPDPEDGLTETVGTDAACTLS